MSLSGPDHTDSGYPLAYGGLTHRRPPSPGEQSKLCLFFLIDAFMHQGDIILQLVRHYYLRKFSQQIFLPLKPFYVSLDLWNLFLRDYFLIGKGKLNEESYHIFLVVVCLSHNVMLVLSGSLCAFCVCFVLLRVFDF